MPQAGKAKGMSLFGSGLAWSWTVSGVYTLEGLMVN